MSRTPATGDMRSAMKDAVKRSKGNKKKALDSKQRWKEQAKKKRKTVSLLALCALAPLALLCLLYPLHTLGYFRLWQPTALSKALANPGQAEKLDLTAQFLDEVPPDIAKLTNLKRLTLDSNQLGTLGDSLWKLQKLQVLNLNNVDIRTIPPEIGALTELRELSVSNNQISELPKELFSLSKLEVLTINSNALTSIPPDIKKLSNLKVLNLKYNRLTAVPEEIASLKSLEQLSLTGNAIGTMPNLSGLKNLKNLAVRKTSLTPGQVKVIKNQLSTEVTVKS